MPPPKGRPAFRAGQKRPGLFNGKASAVKKPQQVRRGPRFNTTRLAEKEAEAAEGEGDEIPDQNPGHTSGEEQEEEEEDTSDESEDEESGPSKHPYLSLMQNLMADGPRGAKRRKLDHLAQEKQGNPVAQEPEKPSEGDEDNDNQDDVDRAEEEPEANPDTVLEEEMLGDDGDDDSDNGNDEKEIADPFKVHFSDPDEDVMRKKVAAIQAGQWHTQRVDSSPSRVFFSTPQATDEPDEQKWSIPGPVMGIKDLKLKKKLHDTMLAKHPDFDAVEQTLAPLLFSYNDLLYCSRAPADGDSVRRLVSLHTLNHIFKTRDRVIKHNGRLARAAAAAADLELRDQGFTRPKVLMLLPTRNACARMVDAICAICAPEQQENRKRFDEAYVDKTPQRFGPDKPEDFCDLFAGNDDDMFRVGIKFTRKTIKFFAEFYSSDLIIASPLGLRMAIGSEEEEEGGRRRRDRDEREDDSRLKHQQQQQQQKKKKKGQDFDFLSSIELVVLDQADALLMQNWEHVDFIMDRLNAQPREAHGCDFSRVRSWCLDGLARHFRQTVVLSAFNTPELAGLLRTHCAGWRGKARVQPAEYEGVIQHLGGGSGSAGLNIRQTFSRFDARSPAADPDARFAYFVKAVVPTLVALQKKRYYGGNKDKDSKDRDKGGSGTAGGAGGGGGGARGTLVFIPSYLDFVRVRNYLAADAAAAALSFGAVSEYAGVREASRARSHFASGRHAVLLYTERAHHFRRYRAMAGVRRVVMYGLPDNPAFYQEVAGGFLAAQARKGMTMATTMMMMGGGGGGEATVRVMFSKYDAIKLERVVGSRRVGKMIRDKGDTFEFV